MKNAVLCAVLGLLAAVALAADETCTQCDSLYCNAAGGEASCHLCGNDGSNPDYSAGVKTCAADSCDVTVCYAGYQPVDASGDFTATNPYGCSACTGTTYTGEGLEQCQECGTGAGTCDPDTGAITACLPGYFFTPENEASEAPAFCTACTPGHLWSPGGQYGHCIACTTGDTVCTVTTGAATLCNGDYVLLGADNPYGLTPGSGGVPADYETSIDICHMCGNYSWSEGGTEVTCHPCNPKCGTCGPTNGTCLTCTWGFHSVAPWNCTPCKTGTWSHGGTPATCSDCSADDDCCTDCSPTLGCLAVADGCYLVGNVAHHCADNYYQVGDDTATSCTNCHDAGCYTCTADTGACTSCFAGKEVSGADCATCAHNYYQDSDGGSHCTTCHRADYYCESCAPSTGLCTKCGLAQYYISGTHKCGACDGSLAGGLECMSASSHTNTECSTCGISTETFSCDTSTCGVTACRQGYYYDVAGPLCTACVAGTLFQPTDGASTAVTSCSSCAADPYDCYSCSTTSASCTACNVGWALSA